MRVAITGSTGLIGSALTTHLRAAGHDVIPVVRRRASTGEIGWDPAAGRVDSSDFAGVEAIVHLAGAGIGDHRWTDAYKREILESRTRSTNLLCEAISAVEGGPKRLLSGSAIGFYGARGDEVLDETSSRGTGFLADVVVDWEASTAMAGAAGISVAHLRTGIVLSSQGGALRKQLPLFKLGLGGRFGTGKQWQSWISITDEVRAIEHLLTSTLSGPVNLTAPAPVTGAAFAKVLGKVLGRPAVVPVPGFGPKILLGGELVDALLLTGQRVLPTALQADGFSFEHADLETALRALLGKPVGPTR
jgi:uncharacterized protein